MRREAVRGMSNRIGVPEFLATDVVFDQLTHDRAVELIGRYPSAR